MPDSAGLINENRKKKAIEENDVEVELRCEIWELKRMQNYLFWIVIALVICNFILFFKLLPQ